MTPENFNLLFESTIQEIRKLAVLKGGEYAPGADRLANFKSNAEALGLKPEAVWRSTPGSTGTPFEPTSATSWRGRPARGSSPSKAGSTT